jgi:hypothetical protein
VPLPSGCGLLARRLPRPRVERDDARNALGHLPKEAAKRVLHIVNRFVAALLLQKLFIVRTVGVDFVRP